MAERTSISWTHATFNPWMGCIKVSEGCRNCYAADLTKRMGYDLWGPGDKRRKTSPAYWREPLKWNRKAELARTPIRVFCASLADVFEDAPTPNAVRPELWSLIKQTPWLDWQLLTKRPENIARMLPPDWGDGWPNVWLGTSVEDMRVAHRIRILACIPAFVRFISYEPALGPIHDADFSGIHWIIYGGESGPHYRPDNVEWARAIRDRCQRDGIAYWYKQAAHRYPGRHTLLDGVAHNELPQSWDRRSILWQASALSPKQISLAL